MVVAMEMCIRDSLYTGMTSVAGDQSNVGFVLVNMRTKETKFYSISGAEENSAMSSAQGRVQDQGYRATFPDVDKRQGIECPGCGEHLEFGDIECDDDECGCGCHHDHEEEE